jgi:AcrR family transcriptional regulator
VSPTQEGSPLTVAEAGNDRGALRRRVRRTRRQWELLDQLQGVFLAEGFAPFTMEDLAVRLHCSKATLYALAPSKEQLAVTVLRHYFAGAAARVEASIVGVADVRERIGRYLASVGTEMRLASPELIADLEAEGVANDIFGDVNAAFLAEVISATLAAIQRGDVRRRTGLSDAESFTELSSLVLRALTTTTSEQ